MSSIGSSKRTRGLQIPSEDLTKDNYERMADLSDRQAMCWALQTETKVRLQKVEMRDTNSCNAFSATLDSKYLLDIYPKNPKFAKWDVFRKKGGPAAESSAAQPSFMINRDCESFSRKCLAMFRTVRDPDSSWASVQRIQIDGHELNESYLDRDARFYGFHRETETVEMRSSNSFYEWNVDVEEMYAVPPNLLYFEMILEALLGYKIPRYHSQDGALPRAAVMGGAIVAALSSWRDPSVLAIFSAHDELFHDYVGSPLWSSSLKPLSYWEKKNQSWMAKKSRVIELLHDYFLFDSEPKSPFSASDVDIFLQASPLTRDLLSKFNQMGLGDDCLKKIESYLGGCGFVQGDLQRFANALCVQSLGPNLEFDTSLVYALASNGLSFMLTRNSIDVQKSFPPVTWPRTTQLIMLNERADLVGALMDFDLSIATCAYDGITVRVAPRASFSLVTLTQTVTPFVLAENRNRKRIVKYWRRGFMPYMIDPNCYHSSQCQKAVDCVIRKSVDEGPPYDGTVWDEPRLHFHFERRKMVRLRHAPFRCIDLHGRDQYRQALEEVEREERFHESICGHWGSTMYSPFLFESTKGDALQFYQHFLGWSQESQEKIEQIPEKLRVVCKNCRFQYGLDLVLRNAPESIKEEKTTDELLHGDMHYCHTWRYSNSTFDPSFYCVGVFNSEWVRSKARAKYLALEALGSQSRAEAARYILKHRTMDGYQSRFIYSTYLDGLFAVTQSFPAPSRAPVGLNPERFIQKCKSCSTWLTGCEFDVDYCERCEDRKPEAK